MCARLYDLCQDSPKFDNVEYLGLYPFIEIEILKAEIVGHVYFVDF